MKRGAARPRENPEAGGLWSPCSSAELDAPPWGRWRAAPVPRGRASGRVEVDRRHRMEVWCLPRAARFLALGSWRSVLGARFLALGSWRSVLGARCALTEHGGVTADRAGRHRSTACKMFTGCGGVGSHERKRFDAAKGAPARTNHPSQPGVGGRNLLGGDAHCAAAASNKVACEAGELTGLQVAVAKMNDCAAHFLDRSVDSVKHGFGLVAKNA